MLDALPVTVPEADAGRALGWAKLAVICCLLACIDYLCCFASGEGIVVLGIRVCVCVSFRQPRLHATIPL